MDRTGIRQSIDNYLLNGQIRKNGFARLFPAQYLILYLITTGLFSKPVYHPNYPKALSSSPVYSTALTKTTFRFYSN